MGHADYQIRNKASGQAGGEGRKSQKRRQLNPCYHVDNNEKLDFDLYNQSDAQILSCCT